MRDIEYPVFLVDSDWYVYEVPSPEQLGWSVEEADILTDEYLAAYDHQGKPLRVLWTENGPAVQLTGDPPDPTRLLRAIQEHALRRSKGHPLDLPDGIDPAAALKLAEQHIEKHRPPNWLARLLNRLRGIS